MADTIESVRIDGLEYQSANSLSGIAVGTSISIQNQTTDEVEFAISATKPDVTFKGVVIPHEFDGVVTISAGENEVWIKGHGPVNIQESCHGL